ncbi:hypothetical protein BGX28_004149 [Mortierella sp. GBA30]|nr:hypothetical protein BGX28_004149 [Mortierella sp. GBA30]
MPGAPPLSLLTQDSRFLLSPVPASLAATQGPVAKSATTSASTTAGIFGGSTFSIITLYPLDPVPSHLLCAICTLPYENPVHFLPCCHVFCLECIQLWIGMNLSDDQLQNELRRAYPAADDIGTGDASQASYHTQQQQQQFMVELARMGEPQSRPGMITTSIDNFYESFSHFSPAQQQILQQQQIQQRIAVLLENREMPKCPMCRTALHIHGWDRIEEQIKVPVSVSQRPISANNAGNNLSLSSSPSEWLNRSGLAQEQRPVSGVERRRNRPDRMGSTGSSGRGSRGPSRGEAIDEEEDEEIEMEHVRSLGRAATSNQSSYSRQGDVMTPFTSSSRRPSRLGRTPRQNSTERFIHLSDGRLFRGNGGDENDDEELQSPTTAVIGRRPSEWMRYQQRQIQAHQEQLQTQRANADTGSVNVNVNDATASTTGAEEQLGQLLLYHEQSNGLQRNTSRYDEQQEQIRRLYQEQESQEELLRTLTARAASIIEAEEESRRRGAESASNLFVVSDDGSAPGGSVHPHDALQNQSDELTGHLNIDSEDDSEPHRAQLRQSTLHIDTSLPRTNIRQSIISQNPSNHSPDVDRDLDPRVEVQQSASPTITQAVDEQPRFAVDQNQGHSESQGPADGNGDEGANNSDDDSSIISAIRQGTRAWARPSNLRLDLEDTDGDMSVSDSVSNSTMSPTESPSYLPLSSPSNDSTMSFRTSSTFSHRNQTSASTPFSRRSSSQLQWDRHSLSLQMPTIETTTEGCVVSVEEHTFGDGTDSEQGHYAEQPWNDETREDMGNLNCRKDCDSGEFSGSTLRSEMSKIEGKSRASKPDRVPPTTTLEGVSKITSGGSSSVENDGVSSDESKTDSATTLDVSLSEQSIVASQGSNSAAPSIVVCRNSDPASPWIASPHGVSPLVCELDIHCPTATSSDGSVATIADMHINADILARARSNSTLLSDEDLHGIGGRPSPLDSPIPTPSTARPRQRFPAGIRLASDEESPEDNDDDGLDVEADEAYRIAHANNQEEQTGISNSRSLEAEVTLEEHAEEIEDNDAQAISASLNGPLAIAGSNEALTTPLDDVVTDEDHPALNVTVSSSTIIYDPLSAAAHAVASYNMQGEDEDARVLQDEHSLSRSTTPTIQPLRATITSSSPPPLPLPLPTTVADDTSVSSPYQEMVDLTPIASTSESRLLANDEVPVVFTEPTRSTSNRSSRRRSSISAMSLEPTTATASASISYLADIRSESRIHNGAEDISPNTGRTETHIQYRTLVRYQPRLPKAHVMSDLISQIRVECPQKKFGCQETMEMQQAFQHSRDQCKYRMAMCPRARCGLWMRADQILNHILMVEPGALLGSSSSSSSFCSRPDSGLSSTSSARSAGSAFGSVQHHRQNGAFGRNDQQRTRRSQQSQSGRQTSSGPKQPVETDTVTDPSIPSCPGLTWEREQLARATGIIGQLTEENTSLRQMIRQLTLQNSKLLKDKDRWQRYANLGLGRD